MGSGPDKLTPKDALEVPKGFDLEQVLRACSTRLDTCKPKDAADLRSAGFPDASAFPDGVDVSDKKLFGLFLISQFISLAEQEQGTVREAMVNGVAKGIEQWRKL